MHQRLHVHYLSSVSACIALICLGGSDWKGGNNIENMKGEGVK